MPPLTRRQFVRTAGQIAAATALTAKSYSQVAGSNDRTRIGIIGFGLVGRIHTRSFHSLNSSKVVAVSDCFGPRMDACAELVGPDCTKISDFRRLLERKDIDAVVISTGDHWHALQTMMACAAGKDVYVEKPLHLFAREGEWMQKVAARSKRVVQVGTQQRSAAHYHKAKDLLRNGAIGELVSVQCNFFRNVMPGIGHPPDAEPPANLDWNMLLGPAPQRRYNPNRALYHFRWFWDYSGGQMTNLGHHSLDVVHWIFDITAPKAVSSSGGRYFLKDNGEVPDTQDAIIEYPKFNAIVEFREAAAGAATTGMGSLTFMGTKGTMTLGRDGFAIIPDKKVEPVNAFAQIIGGHPVGGPQPVPEPEGDFWCEKAEDQSGDWKQQYVEHAKNFLECIRNRRTPNSDLASSHWVSTTCHLANISARTGRKIVWNSAANDIDGDKAASAMLTRPYRAPWDAELKTLLG
ncbi:MAG TPA: Gfo/Idh/MocA family oxidoreductase [Verrucomicrobiae bacterium]|nr:Gfo/Idh/MocA family oxidoreductase [Verrucomicrobiae bacterium]